MKPNKPGSDRRSKVVRNNGKAVEISLKQLQRKRKIEHLTKIRREFTLDDEQPIERDENNESRVRLGSCALSSRVLQFCLLPGAHNAERATSMRLSHAFSRTSLFLERFWGEF